MTQVCAACTTEKDLSEFSFRKDSGKHRPECKPCRSLASQAARYGLAREELISLLSEASCEACGDSGFDHAAFAHTRGLVIDHCHITGKVRGVLCARCNCALGQLQDDPDRIRGLLAYIEQ